MSVIRASNFAGRNPGDSAGFNDGINVTAGVVTCTDGFKGALTGNVTGSLTGHADSATTATTATTATGVSTSLSVNTTGIITASSSTAGVVTCTDEGIKIGSPSSAAGIGITLGASGIISATQYHGNAAGLINIQATEITGQIPAANLGNVDLTGIRQDISKLALQVATDSNKAAYNMTDSWIDQFENNSGISTFTDCTYDSSSEYWATQAVQTDPNIVELWYGWGGAGDTSGVNMDGEKGVGRIQETGDNGQTRVTSSGKFETSTLLRTGDWNGSSKGFSLTQISGTPFNMGSGAFTFECWIELVNTSYSNNHNYIFDLDADNNNSNRWTMAGQNGGTSYNGSSVAQGGWNWGSGGMNNSGWNHCGIIRNASGNTAVFVNGNMVQTGSQGGGDNNNFSSGNNMNIGERHNQIESGYFYYDAIRLYSSARYDPTQTTYTVPTAKWETTSESTNATGSLESTTQTASSAQTKVSGVMLYKNNAGTATLGTDIKVSFSCNNGTNWSVVPTYTAGSDFSTGIKTVYLAETTCTSGTQIKYKVEWANQAAGSKETWLYGMAMNY